MKNFLCLEIAEFDREGQFSVGERDSGSKKSFLRLTLFPEVDIRIRWFVPFTRAVSFWRHISNTRKATISAATG